MYIDGIWEATVSTTGLDLTNNYDLYIGIDYQNTTFNNYFKGQIDDVRIYNQILPDEYIAQMANEPGLISQWKMDDAEAPDFQMNTEMVMDSRGGHNGNLVSGTRTHGRYGGGLYLDGNDDYVTVPDSDNLDFGTAGDFSVSAWIKTSYSAGNQRIVFKKNDAFEGYTLTITATTGKARLNVKGIGQVTATYVDSTTTVTNGQWHHIAGVRDADANIKIYVDGGLQGTVSTTTMDLTNTFSLYLGIDRQNGTLNNDFYGKIDDIRIYNRALSSAYISAMAAKKAVWYVDDSAPAGGTGGSWASPLNSFSSSEWGIPSSGDEVRMGTGNYIFGEYSLTIALTMKGGYSGYGAADPGVRDITQYVTSIYSNGGSQKHVIKCVGPGSLTLDGLTIYNGLANGTSSPDDRGAGIYFDGISLTVHNCIFTNNIANGPGGGIYCKMGQLTVDQCWFEGNQSVAGTGGGIYDMAMPSGDPSISNSVFVSNRGGGIRIVDIDGGTIKSCQFLGHTSSGYSGPGIRIDAVDYDCGIEVINCLFSGNASSTSGGGIYLLGNTPPTMTSTSSGDRYANTSTLNNANAWATIVNCSLSGNTAVYNGGGLFVGVGATASVNNSIFWGNIANGTSNQIKNNGTLTVTYSDIQGGWAGTGNINSNPLFVDADGTDNTFGTEDDDVRLVNVGTISPAIDAGNNGLISEPKDMDGMPRTMDGDGNSSVIADMGAFESWYDSNPGNPDNDYDSMSDLWEVFYGFDPDTYGGDDDTDGDWMLDWEEYYLWTNPREKDTDQDTFTDGEEYYIFETYPWQFDGDEDKNGIPDIVEDGTQWGLDIDTLDLETTSELERSNVYGHVGININTIPWYANSVIVYLDDQLVGDLWEGMDDENQWIGLESETFANGWHTVRIVTTDFYGIPVYHRPVMVCFNNPISNVVCEDYFDPAEDYTYCGFYAGTGTLDASLVDLYGQVVWSNTYSGPNVSIVIPQSVFAAQQLVTLSIASNGVTVTEEDLTREFKQADYPNGARMVIVIPKKDIFKVRKPAILACAQACVDRGVTWVALYKYDANQANLTYLFQKPAVRYIYWCGHGNNYFEWDNGAITYRTFTECWKLITGSLWDSWKKIPALSWTKQTFPSAPFLPRFWDQRGFDLYTLGMSNQWNKKIVFIDACRSAEYSDMADAYGIFSLQGQASQDQIYIGWKTAVVAVTGPLAAILGDSTLGVQRFWEGMGQGKSIWGALWDAGTNSTSIQKALWGENREIEIADPDSDDNLFLWGSGNINTIKLNP